MASTATIKYLGHSTVLISSEQERHIIIDPWINDNPQCPIKETDITALDYICITHGHYDHCSSAISLARQTGATVICHNELGALLVKDGLPKDQLERMSKGGILKLGQQPQLGFALTHALHSNSYPASNGQKLYAGEACGIIVQLESGRTIYHAGDTTIFSDMEIIGDLYAPTVALLPIGGRYTMDPFLASHATTLIAPEYVIPIHYGTFDELPGSAKEFCEYLVDLQDVQVKPLKPGDEFTF